MTAAQDAECIVLTERQIEFALEESFPWLGDAGRQQSEPKHDFLFFGGEFALLLQRRGEGSRHGGNDSRRNDYRQEERYG